MELFHEKGVRLLSAPPVSLPHLLLSKPGRGRVRKALEDFWGSMESIISFMQNNTVITIAIAVILFFLIHRKPKLFLGILSLGLFLAVLFYLITSLAGTGSKQKKSLFIEGERQSEAAH